MVNVMKTVDAIGLCMICSGPCFHMDPLCKRCWLRWPELQKPKREWPEWAKGLWAFHRMHRYRERRMFRNEHFSEYSARLYDC